MISYYEGQLLDIMPVNLQNEQTIAISFAVQQTLQRLLESLEACSVYAAVEKLPDLILDLAASELRTQYYDNKLPRKVREQLVTKTLAWYMRSGTASVLEEYLATIYSGGRVLEWHEYDGNPYYFKVIVSVEEEAYVPIEECKAIIKKINTYKNVRSWLEVLILKMPWYINWYIDYSNRFKLCAEFYPRYNLAYHYWEGEHPLDGGKYLNGYDSAALVDFYPVVQVISVDVLPDVKEEPILCSTADVCCKTAMDVKNTVMADVVADAGLATGAWAAGDVDVCHEESASMRFKAGVAEPVISEANGTYYRAEASAAPKAVGTGTVGAAYPVGADYQNKLTVEKNLRYLEGMRTLSGAGLLNAEIFDYTL